MIITIVEILGAWTLASIIAGLIIAHAFPPSIRNSSNQHVRNLQSQGSRCIVGQGGNINHIGSVTK